MTSHWAPMLFKTLIGFVLFQTSYGYFDGEICHSKRGVLICPFGTTVQIEKALYGRPSTQCEQFSFSCSGKNVIRKVRRMCSGKRICVVDTNLLGNPCMGVWESLVYRYTCRAQVTAPPTTTQVPTTESSIKKKIVCENYSTFLGCASGKVINILSAFYGRRSTAYCPTGDTSNTSCSVDATKYARFYAQGRSVGIAQALSSLHGDPCPGISKYLQINYECVLKPTTTPLPTTPKPTTESPIKTKTICENYSSFLGCASGKVINILSAFYGRRSTAYCPTGDTSNTSCSVDATKYARFYAQGRSVGIAQALSSLHGDPCPGISKYLQISFECVDKDALATTNSPTDTKPPLPPKPTTPVGPPVPPATCGTPQVAQSRIVGGINAKSGAWPWQVALYRKGNFWCGGALIDPMWIVTATHCLERLNSGDFIGDYHVILGDHDRTSNEGTEIKRYLSKMILHPQYDKGHRYNNDIALIKMSGPILFSNRILPICLPAQGQSLPTNTNCFVTGWGMTSYPSSPANVLQQGSMATVSKQECAQRLQASLGNEKLSISDQMLCAGNSLNSPDKELSACRGDSGGPFVCQGANGKWSLQGVVSWGSIRCSGVDRYSVFARVSEFRDWIDDVIKHDGLPPTTPKPITSTTEATTEQSTVTPVAPLIPGPEPPL